MVIRRLAAIAVLAIAPFAGYRYYDGTYAPEKKYRDFAEEIVRRHYDAAAAMTDGLSAQDLAKAGTQEKVGGGPTMFQTLFPSRFDVESRTATSLGVTLHAVQTVLFNPPGVESATRPAMYAKMNQVVALHKTDGGWKVTSFENKFDKMDSLTGR
jgi:hypothetical protein